MGKLDKALQLKTLQLLNGIYPKHIDIKTYDAISGLFKNEKDFAANIQYLEDKGLIIGGFSIGGDGRVNFKGNLRITAEGIGFLKE